MSTHNHHELAAKHLDAAADHHNEAHKALLAGDAPKAALHANVAAGHQASAKEHCCSADKACAKENSTAKPEVKSDIKMN